MGCALLFTVGSLGQKLGCQTLEDPEGSELYGPLEDAINDEIQQELNSTDWENVTYSLTVILDQCQENLGIFTVRVITF